MLVKYLELVTDAEHKLALAMACHCHSAAVDVRLCSAGLCSVTRDVDGSFDTRQETAQF